MTYVTTPRSLCPNLSNDTKSLLYSYRYFNHTRIVANSFSQLMPEMDAPACHPPGPGLDLDLGLDSRLLGGVLTDARRFVSDVIELILDPLGRTRDLGPSVSSSLVMILHTPPLKAEGQ